MVNLYTQVDKNIAKTWFYLGSFFVLVIFVGWLISYSIGTPVVLWFSVIFSILMSFISYWYSDKIVLSLSGAMEVKKEDNPELYRLLENLSITAGLPVPKLYIIEEEQPNAFATGKNPKNSAIAVTRGLVERLERVEIEGVLAHELAHIGNRDILLSTIVVVLVGIIVIITDFFFRISFWGARSRDRGRNQVTLLFFIVAIVLAILAPIFAQLIKFAISRKREFLADASGALLTRYPEGLARALGKISNSPEPMRRSFDATAHLFIANPFRQKERNYWLHKLFMTHPPIEERIRILRGMKV